MSEETDLSYTLQELLDYLPAGWVLADPSDPGDWIPKRRCWQVGLRDGADVDWELCIDGRTAARAGRVEALKEAVDELYREALGAPGLLG